MDEIDLSTPHAARIWNYWMGGHDNYEADRAAGDYVASVYPEIVTMAKLSRKFLVRVVHYLAAEAGVDQFLDIGTGLPTMENTHEVAQRANPAARIVYVDNDPLVLAHARALLTNTTPEGVTTYVPADYNDPQVIVDKAREVLDFDRPIAVMFMGVLGYVEQLDDMKSIIGAVVEPLASGSHMVLWDGTDTGEAVIKGQQRLTESGAVPYYLRSPAELASCFPGFELIEPGMVPISEWRPTLASVGDSGRTEFIDAYGAVGRRP